MNRALRATPLRTRASRRHGDDSTKVVLLDVPDFEKRVTTGYGGNVLLRLLQWVYGRSLSC